MEIRGIARVLVQQRKQERLNEEFASDNPSGSSDIVRRMQIIEQILLDAKQDRQEIESQWVPPSSRRSRLRGGSSVRLFDFDDQLDPDQNRTIPRDSLGQREEASNEGSSRTEAVEVHANNPSPMPYVIPHRRASSDTRESSIAMTSGTNVSRTLSPDEFVDGIGQDQPPRHLRYSGRGQRAAGGRSRRAASSAATSQVEVRHQATRQPRPPLVNLHATAFQQPRSGRSRRRPSTATPKPFEALETLTEDEERDKWQTDLRAQIQDEVNRSKDTTGDRTSDVEKTSASSQSTSARTQDLRGGAGLRLFMPSFSSEEDDGSDPCSPAESEGSIIVCPAVSDTTRTRLATKQLLGMARHSEYSQWLYDRATRVVPSRNADYQSCPTSQRFYHHHYFHTTTADSAASRPQPCFGPDAQNNLFTTSHASPGSYTSGHDLFKSPTYSTSQRQSRSSASTKSTRYRNKLNFDVFEDALVPADYDELGQLAPDEREPLQSLGRNATAGRLASNEAAILDQQGRQAQRHHGSEEDGAEISPRTTLATQTFVAERVPTIPSPAHDIHVWTSLIPEPGSSARRQDPHITSDEEDSGDEDAASSTDPLPFGLFGRGRRHQCPKCYLWHEIAPSSSMPMVGTSPREYSRMCTCPECRYVHRQRKNADTEAMDDATLFTTDRSKNVLDRQADLAAARGNSPPPDSVLSSPAFD
ncbi:hypothetical protein LTR05_002183 [Lithohypha guttulata]|uniref:Uncharacterized protein n=1 Tax=Lithohypha guttulata TaxID=1690604 RepID=A0AAN7T1U0_9EURO|nr:hypothetical protein LTR05_002183 [Lithohypha guttulata]